MFKEASKFIAELASQGRIVLFVGTKRQAQDAIAEEAQRCNGFYVNQRWLGGLLTNWVTVQKSVKRLKELDEMATDGRDRKSTRLNSSHLGISYAVFCLKKKKKENNIRTHIYKK